MLSIWGHALIARISKVVQASANPLMPGGGGFNVHALLVVPRGAPASPVVVVVVVQTRD
jgi:hypothetical protein